MWSQWSLVHSTCLRRPRCIATVGRRLTSTRNDVKPHVHRQDSQTDLNVCLSCSKRHPLGQLLIGVTGVGVGATGLVWGLHSLTFWIVQARATRNLAKASIAFLHIGSWLALRAFEVVGGAGCILLPFRDRICKELDILVQKVFVGLRGQRQPCWNPLVAIVQEVLLGIVGVIVLIAMIPLLAIVVLLSYVLPAIAVAAVIALAVAVVPTSAARVEKAKLVAQIILQLVGAVLIVWVAVDRYY